MNKSKFDLLEVQLADVKSLLSKSEQSLLNGDFLEAPTGLEVLVKNLCDELPKLPSKDEAYGLIANVLQAPVGKFATLLNEVPSQLARVLSAVRDNKEASA